MGSNEEKLAAHESRLNAHDDYICDLHAKIDQMLDYQRRQQGFMAGIVFTVGAIITGVTWLFNSGFQIK